MCFPLLLPADKEEGKIERNRLRQEANFVLPTLFLLCVLIGERWKNRIRLPTDTLRAWADSLILSASILIVFFGAVRVGD